LLCLECLWNHNIGFSTPIGFISGCKETSTKTEMKCKICGGDVWEKTLDNFNVYFCPLCGGKHW
jgi:Zn finger protein HypA/HybF involved in hydrogenase expression